MALVPQAEHRRRGVNLPRVGRRVEYLTPPKARGLVEEAIAPLLADFQPVRPGVWARPLSAEVRAMLTLQSWKGATFSLTYGVCCSWVPYRSGGGNRYEWPATVKQSHPHLWVDHFSVDAPREEYISYIEGEAQLRRTALTAMNAAAERAPGWWRGVREPEGVLAEARRQAGSQMDLHWPSALFVEAFTLARLGQQVGARERLGRAGLEELEGREIADRVARLLAEVANRPDLA
jgi:hypothetical protein